MEALLISTISEHQKLRRTKTFRENSTGRLRTAETSRRIKAIQQRDELRITMRVVHIGLAPVINEMKHDMHHLVHPDPAALIQIATPKIGTENHLNGIVVASERLRSCRAGRVRAGSDGVAGAAIGNTGDGKNHRIDIVLGGLQAPQDDRQPHIRRCAAPTVFDGRVKVKDSVEGIADGDDIRIGRIGRAYRLGVGYARNSVRQQRGGAPIGTARVRVGNSCGRGWTRDTRGSYQPLYL